MSWADLRVEVDEGGCEEGSKDRPGQVRQQQHGGQWLHLVEGPDRQAQRTHQTCHTTLHSLELLVILSILGDAGFKHQACTLQDTQHVDALPQLLFQKTNNSTLRLHTDPAK